MSSFLSINVVSGAFVDINKDVQLEETACLLSCLYRLRVPQVRAWE